MFLCCVLCLTVMGHFWFYVSCFRRLMFPSKISPSLNIPDLHPKVTYCFSEGSTVSYHNVFAIYCLTCGYETQLTCLLCSFRSSMVCHCLPLSVLSKSRKNFYVSQMGKRQWNKTVSSQPKTRRRWKHTGQVNIHSLVILSIMLAQKCCIPQESICSDIVSPPGCSKTSVIVWTPAE